MIGIKASKGKAGITFEIKDSGIGMEKETLNRSFEQISRAQSLGRNGCLCPYSSWLRWLRKRQILCQMGHDPQQPGLSLDRMVPVFSRNGACPHFLPIKDVGLDKIRHFYTARNRKYLLWPEQEVFALPWHLIWSNWPHFIRVI